LGRERGAWAPRARAVSRQRLATPPRQAVAPGKCGGSSLPGDL